LTMVEKNAIGYAIARERTVRRVSHHGYTVPGSNVTLIDRELMSCRKIYADRVPTDGAVKRFGLLVKRDMVFSPVLACGWKYGATARLSPDRMVKVLGIGLGIHRHY